MSEVIEINCIGMKCPRPIIEIAKAARKSPGSTLKIQADDFAFESDVNAWIENANATMTNMSKEGDVITVEISL